MSDASEYPKELVESIELLARIVCSESDVSSTIRRVADLAVYAIDGAEHGSVALVEAGDIRPVAATSEMGEVVERIQQEADEGPSRSCIREHRSFNVLDVEHDLRWPVFSHRVVAETPLRSMLTLVLDADQMSLGAMNLMSSRPGAFDADDFALAAVFAVQAGVAVRNAQGHAKDQLLRAQLEEGLETRKVIGQATGLLMGQEGLTSEEAFQRLLRISQTAHIKVREIAERYVHAWEKTLGSPPGSPGSVPQGSDHPADRRVDR